MPTRPKRTNYSISLYKGYEISHDFYGMNEYSVFCDGEDIIFKTIEDARAFIDDTLFIDRATRRN